MKTPETSLRPRFQFRAMRLLAAGLFTSLAAHAASPSSAEFFFHNGDRAMILGDSITQQRLYSTLVESYVVSRFPEWKITFRNTGWSGDTMGLRTRNGLDKGFDRDIKPLAPTAVTIDFGMNDARAGDPGAAIYADNARKLADKFSALGTRLAFVTSSPEEKYQEGQPAGSAYNTLLKKYSEGLEQVAAEKNVLFVDQLNPMIKVIEDGRAAGVLVKREGGPRLINDAVHPSIDGHMIMAAAILKGLNAPALVSSVEVNASSGAVKTSMATVTAVKTGDTVSFTRLDACMPWPVPSTVSAVLKIPGFTPFDELSLYTLKVTGLAAASYEVGVDGKSLGNYTKEQLAAGVNLSDAARQNFPEVKALWEAVVAKNEAFYARWRGVQVAEIPDWVPADAVEQSRAKKLVELDAKITELEARLDGLRAPKVHQWTVSPAH